MIKQSFILQINLNCKKFKIKAIEQIHEKWKDSCRIYLEFKKYKKIEFVVELRLSISWTGETLLINKETQNTEIIDSDRFDNWVVPDDFLKQRIKYIESYMKSMEEKIN